MAPDLNSLPSSRPSSVPGSPQSQRPRRISSNNIDTLQPSSTSPRSPSLSSLQAAATINAGFHRPPGSSSPAQNHHPGLERRRPSLLNNFSINDPAVPGPGEMQLSNGSNASSPGLGRRSFILSAAGAHHQRQPSLGELHQELENEQEAQVNRLLNMIRIQQDQLAHIQRQQQQQHDLSPTNDEQASFPNTSSISNMPATNALNDQPSSPNPGMAPSPHSHFNRSGSLSRQSSYRLSNAGTNSRGNSPALRPQAGSLAPTSDELLLGGTRDECAFYQAETQMLTRENQMLKLRIRELERQIADMSGSSSMLQGSTAVAPIPSPLANQPATFAGEVVPSVPAEAEPAVKID